MSDWQRRQEFWAFVVLSVLGTLGFLWVIGVIA